MGFEGHKREKKADNFHIWVNYEHSSTNAQMFRSDTVQSSLEESVVLKERSRINLRQLEAAGRDGWC